MLSRQSARYLDIPCAERRLRRTEPQRQAVLAGTRCAWPTAKLATSSVAFPGDYREFRQPRQVLYAGS